MKVIICFDEEKLKKIKICDEDFVLINGKLDNVNFNVVDISKTHIDYTEYKSEYDNSLDKFFKGSGLNENEIKLINSISPSLYLHNLRFCIFWIKSFIEVLNHSVTEIVFTDYVEDLKYFPLYEAEGEVNKKLFYYSFDFISPQLMKYAEEFASKNTNCSIKIIKRHSKYRLKFRIFARRHLLFFSKIFFHVFKLFTKVKLTRKLPISVNGIISTRSLSHSIGLEKFLLSNKNCIVHVCEGLTFSSPNFYFLKKRLVNVISQYETLSLSDLYNSIAKCHKFLKRVDDFKSINILGVSLHLKSLYVESVISYLEADLYSKSIYNLAKKNNIKYVITPEVISIYPIWLKKYFSCLDTKIIQLQTVALDILPIPNFIFTDLFLFDSENVCNYFKKIFPSDSCKLMFWGNINIENAPIIRKKVLRNIIFFTQPYELKEQREFLLRLSDMTKSRGIGLHIKPHPRENMDMLLMDINFHINILPKNFTINEFNSFCDLAILRTSSITQDLIIQGLPVLNVLLSSFDRSIKLDYLGKNNLNVCYSYNQVENIVDDFHVYFDKFYSFRNEYMKRQGLTKGLLDFNKKVQSYLL